MAKRWPTPCSVSAANPDPSPRDPKRGERLQAAARWPTPLASDVQGGPRAQDGKRGTNLPEMVARWPTPCTTDSKDAARSTTETGVMHPGTTLTDAMRSRHPPTTARAGSDGGGTAVLNPAFVEALLGLPEGWTHVDDELASNILATPAARTKPRQQS